MKTLQVLACAAVLSLAFSGCGPTLQDTKVQYSIAVPAAKATLDTLTTLRDANQLTPDDVVKVKATVKRFEMYRVRVRAAIDANVPAPLTDITNLKEVLDELVIYEISGGGLNE